MNHTQRYALSVLIDLAEGHDCSFFKPANPESGEKCEVCGAMVEMITNLERYT